MPHSPSPFYQKPGPATEHVKPEEIERTKNTPESTGKAFEGPTRSQLEEWYVTLRGFETGELPEEAEDVRDAIYSFLR